MKDEALKLALEALETELAVDMTNGAEVGEAAELMFEAITAIKQALAAQPAVQEPVARVSLQWLAEMILSDCGHSSNYTPLLDRVKARIEQWERANSAPTPPAQPAVPDAIGPNEDELPAYAAGWNDCRAEMLKGMK
jgi:hypothetical protein